MTTKRLSSFFNPEQFQGWGKKRTYFEGWYFKVVNATESRAFAFIPGIAIDELGNRHSFIQVLDGKRQTSQNHQFPFASFVPRPGKFEIDIQGNRFTDHSMALDLPNATGELRFSCAIPWPKHWYSPGIMGPYAFVPFMECYHGIVSMDHEIRGKLTVDGEEIDFAGGRGYIEKDWGKSFPSAYAWVQSNHFREPGISVKASVAKIPWLRSSFVGFIAGAWVHDRLFQFTTYNHSTLRKLDIGPAKVEIVIENDRHLLDLTARREATGTLASPIRGVMDGRIEESMTSTVEVSLVDRKTGRTILSDTGRNAGLEVAGNISEIITPRQPIG